MLNLFQHPTNKVRRQYLASGMPIRRLTDGITARVAPNEKEPRRPVGALFRSSYFYYYNLISSSFEEKKRNSVIW